jgi:hypothetical protein
MHALTADIIESIGTLEFARRRRSMIEAVCAPLMILTLAATELIYL